MGPCDRSSFNAHAHGLGRTQTLKNSTKRTPHSSQDGSHTHGEAATHHDASRRLAHTTLTPASHCPALPESIPPPSRRWGVGVYPPPPPRGAPRFKPSETGTSRVARPWALVYTILGDACQNREAKAFHICGEAYSTSQVSPMLRAERAYSKPCVSAGVAPRSSHRPARKAGPRGFCTRRARSGKRGRDLLDAERLGRKAHE
jgi:hypothetical protein